MKLLSMIALMTVISTASAADKSFDQFWDDAQKPKRADKSEASQRRLDWWRDAKFGMFIHWDPSSLAASEISWSKQFYDDNGENLRPNPRPDRGGFTTKPWDWRVSWFLPAVPREVYDNLHKSFYPGMFDADRIVGQAKQAGMKYIVMISKHHDGFSMYDTAFSDYNVMNTPFKRDILGEMAAATRRAGLKFGFYYSQRDWHHPDYSDKDLKKYNDFMKNQVRELLTKYGPISLIFFDNEYLPAEAWDAKNLIKMIYEIQPDIVINDRCCVPADFSTPEQRLGSFDLERDWESCMTFTGFWSWHGFTTTVIPYEECLERLVRCACGNGNLLMNVGPMATGQIDPREADRLQRVGKWLEKNGESIYGTRGGPFKPGEWGGSTRKGSTVYLHILKWKGDSVTLPALPNKVTTSALLTGGAVKVEQTAGALRITVAPGDRGAVDTVVKLELNGPAMGIAPISTAEEPVRKKK